ncbi:hypothetical protein JJB99_26370 [Bradyrhizobium diazoefficiens]|uniref:hypothetical protein n=1 Tax=Bradyrhizobium diazoefficiens TaxID=1355477 RepID=UPI00190B43ED|nr:hypothetical protein [Bradyrhizobium diazoefficiens]QQO12937.1 hypothetical protein JJB99_26370 [Bradyrhizobium diazoefficiens]
MSTRQKVTSTELKQIIQQRLGSAVFVTIHRNAQLGFTATVVAPIKAVGAQQAVDAIVQDPRLAYELVDLKAHSSVSDR